MSKQILKTGFENPEKVSQVPITVIRRVLPITTSHDPAMCSICDVAVQGEYQRKSEMLELVIEQQRDSEQ